MEELEVGNMRSLKRTRSCVSSTSSQESQYWLEKPVFELQPSNPYSPFSAHSSYSPAHSPDYSPGYLESSDATVPLPLDYYSMAFQDKTLHVPVTDSAFEFPVCPSTAGNLEETIFKSLLCCL